MKVALVIAVFLFLNLAGNTETVEKTVTEEEESMIKENSALTFKEENSEKKSSDGVFVESKNDRVFVTVSVKYPTPEGNFKIKNAKMIDGKVVIELEDVKSEFTGAVPQVVTYKCKTVSFARSAFGENLPSFTVKGKKFEAVDM